MTPDLDLLVVGAGPVGLTVAIQAMLMGARVRVVERREGLRPWAPALAIHPRTMEILRSLGAADELMGRGLERVDLSIQVGERKAEGSLGSLRLRDTEYPFIFFAPQPVVEGVLVERLSGLGREVDWATELTGYETSDDGVSCDLRDPGGVEMISTRYLIGCDGAASTVRRLAKIPFRGRSYRESIVVADAGPTPDLQEGVAHAFVRGRGILFLFPLPNGGWRLIAPGPRLEGVPDVETLVAHHTKGRVRLGDVGWARTVTPQHRLASTFRRGRVFLAGDAAHVHSPAGAQGMNTGIQDGANLGWKLALAARGAPGRLADSYQVERRPVARHVVRLTGLAYALEVSRLPPLRWGRRWAALPVARILTSRPRLVSLVARTVSGLDIRYRRGAIDQDRRSWSRFGAGRRLPDATVGHDGSSRLHRLIDTSAFHLIVSEGIADLPGWDMGGYGDALRVHRWPGRLDGLAWVLVRPDGYIATSGDGEDLGPAVRYLECWVGREAAPPSIATPSTRSTERADRSPGV